MTPVEPLQLSGVPGVRWVPDHATGVGAPVLAGSRGRADSPRAELLARHGVLAESIQWFGGPGQHDGPWEIPIELFLRRVAELAKDSDRRDAHATRRDRGCGPASRSANVAAHRRAALKVRLPQLPPDLPDLAHITFNQLSLSPTDGWLGP